MQQLVLTCCVVSPLSTNVFFSSSPSLLSHLTLLTASASRQVSDSTERHPKLMWNMFGRPLIPTGFVRELSTQTFVFGVKVKGMSFWVSMANEADVLQKKSLLAYSCRKITSLKNSAK